MLLVPVTDPGFDAIMVWDETDAAPKYAHVGTGLTYTHATHTLTASASGVIAADTQVIFSDGANNPVGATALTWDKTSNILTMGVENSFAQIVGPNAASGNNTGTEIDIIAGNGHGSGAGGVSSLTGGTGGATGNGGGVSLSAGAGGATSGAGGTVSIYAGTATAGASSGGDILFKVGDKTGAGTAGKFKFQAKNGSVVDGILDFDSLASTNKTFTFPNATGTITLNDSTAVLTNKTYDTGGTGNIFQLNSNTVSVDAAPVLGDVLKWNGTSWSNAPATSTSAGPGVAFYNSTPIITATGTNNASLLGSLTHIPVTTTEQTVATAVNNSTVLGSAWSFVTALQRTQIDAGTWNFNIYAAMSNGGAGRNIVKNVYQIVPSTTAGNTITTSGSGTTRTATASAGTPFVSGDASATNTSAAYLQTPQGLYQISAFSSSTVVTIIVPSGYVNESTIAFSTWKNLFGATSSDITSTGTNYALLQWVTTQPIFSLAVTDTIGSIQFVHSGNSTTITTTYNGTTHNSFMQSPLSVLHNDLAGLQGGSSGQYYHLTSTEYTGTGTGAFVRQSGPTITGHPVIEGVTSTGATGTGKFVFDGTPTLVTPILGTPTSGTLTNCTGLPIAGLVASTSTAIGVGSIELGAASDTTIARVGAGQISVEGVNVVTISSSDTLTNKRITPRVLSAAAYTTDTGSSINGDTQDMFIVTAQTGALKFNNPTGTPTDGQKLIITVASSTTSARALTWDTAYGSTTVTLPSTTAATTATLSIGFIWSASKSLWQCVASA